MNATHQAASASPVAPSIPSGGGGGIPDALELLARRPDLRADKNAVVDLALDEYYYRCDHGETPDLDAFCDRFPTFRVVVRGAIAAGQVFDAHAHLFPRVLPVRWPAPGERLGDWTLLRNLGKGAFARVYLAREESTGGRPVALKVSAEGAAEARTLGRLSHPNVVPILSVRFEESIGLSAVCMPYLGAATLTDLIDAAYPTADSPPPRGGDVVRQTVRGAARPGDPAPLGATPIAPGRSRYVDAVARLTGQIADGLAFLHSQGVCHRDLKPSNVLLGPAGQALLLDFNLATETADAPHFGGTLQYMAPELLRALVGTGPGGPLDERLDLFALGVIVYELLTGKHPFGAKPGRPSPPEAAALLERQRAGHLPLRGLNQAVDPRLARLVERCIAFDPAARPASAAAVVAELRRHQSTPARIRRWAGRRPWAVAAMAGLLLLAIGGAAYEVAVQETADARAYRRGREYFQAGDYTHAAEWFNQAVEDSAENPKPRKYYLARAAAALRLGEAADDNRMAKNLFTDASRDLSEANTQHADGPTAALVGYCDSRLGYHEQAIIFYADALHAGFQSAGLYNDLGYSRMQNKAFDEAQSDLDKAILCDPRLQAALYNRAVLALQRRQKIAPPPLPEMLLDDMQHSVELGGGSQGLYYTAAHLFAAAAQDEDPANPRARAKQALYCLEKAAECGLDPERIKGDPLFTAVLGGDAEYDALLKAPRRPAAHMTTPVLVNPAPYFPD